MLGEESRNSIKITPTLTKRGARESKQLQNYTHVHEARRKRVETAAKLHLRSRSEGEECRNSCKITLTFTKRGEKSKQLQNYTYVHEARRKRVETAAKLHLRSQREREESQPWETSYVISLEINWPYLSSHTFQPVKFNLLNEYNVSHAFLYAFSLAQNCATVNTLYYPWRPSLLNQMVKKSD